ncbi:hypothetical protein [Lysinibacter sp. HNR]|uniref:hypothetical protein n=1 Tax=Lysinibacter sp. HNR TaxID=3031408 RepID=UPI0024350A50|nr:hypothetical protein [Lysinibacter sp. HNR]WGD36802.1 hypothetical protein FrondiHNR_10100 [Lysinibacter sp. HNR]
MSAIKNPVGPHSRRVYARRRLVALLGLIALIVVIILIVVRPGSGSEEKPAVQGSAAPETPAASEPVDCAAGNVVVTPQTDSTTYGVGALPQISLNVINNGSTPCTINAGTAAMVFTIKSGDETYWTSTDCQVGAVDNFVILEPGVSAPSEPFAWERVRSASDTCEGDRPAVPAGGASYHLSVSLGGIESTETAQFILS